MDGDCAALDGDVLVEDSKVVRAFDEDCAVFDDDDAVENDEVVKEFDVNCVALNDDIVEDTRVVGVRVVLLYIAETAQEYTSVGFTLYNLLSTRWHQPAPSRSKSNIPLMRWPILQRINSVEEMHFGPAITSDNHGWSERRLESQHD